MYNLFVKDFFLVKKHLWIAVFYSFLIFFMFNGRGIESQTFVYTMGITMIGYTLIMYITAYDDKNNSDILLNSLPVSKFTIVLSRYLSIFIFSLIGAVSMIVAGAVLKSIGIIDLVRPMKLEDYIGALTALCTIGFIYLPIYYKIGYVKAKMFNLLLFAAIGFGIPMLINTLLSNVPKPLWIDESVRFIISQSDLIIGIALLVFIFLLGIVSCFISLMFYKRREF